MENIEIRLGNKEVIMKKIELLKEVLKTKTEEDAQIILICAKRGNLISQKDYISLCEETRAQEISFNASAPVGQRFR